MALAQVETLKQPGLREIKKVQPWEDIWKSGIDHKIIYRTAGLCLNLQAAQHARNTHSGIYAAEYWHQQAAEELQNYLDNNPRGYDVVRRLHESGMLAFGKESKSRLYVIQTKQTTT